MKAISVKEPWATLIASGKKTIETRTWNTKYRSDVLICASQRPKTPASGKALCVVTIADSREMVKGDQVAAQCNTYPNAKSWVLVNLRKIRPFPVKGQLGFFNVDDKKIEFLE